MSRDNTLYKPQYGAWAGRPKGTAPNFERCCEEVRAPGTWPRYHQCTRKRGHGPGEAYCKTHDPAAVKAREDAAEAKFRADWERTRYQIHGRTFYTALKKIADGHNDARGFAQEVLAKFDEGARK